MVASIRDVGPAALGLLAKSQAGTDDVRRQTLAFVAAAVAAGQPIPLLAAIVTFALVAVALLPWAVPATVRHRMAAVVVPSTAVLAPPRRAVGAPPRWHPAGNSPIEYLTT